MGTDKGSIAKGQNQRKAQDQLVQWVLGTFRTFRVFDPACGSGNFLYLALQSLKDFSTSQVLKEKFLELGRQFPTVGPEAVMGIELNAYAAELARVTVWIGEIQWMKKNGFDIGKRPILRPLQNIECTDALLDENSMRKSGPQPT